MTTKWLVHKDAVEGVDYNLDEPDAGLGRHERRGPRMVEENQRGINSPAFVPGPYSTIQEDGVIQFVDWYLATIEPRLLGTGKKPLKEVA